MRAVSSVPRRLGLDKTDPVYYTLADGDGYTNVACEAGLDVSGHPRSAAHPFYARLNRDSRPRDFDGFVEGLCKRFYADEGRPGPPPGSYFRLPLIGYFEGLDADSRGPGAHRPEAEEQRLERRLDPSARSRRHDHEDER